MLNINMRAFHNRLFQKDEVHDAEFESLSELTQATSTQMVALQSALGWTDWGA